jgi:hypothetical protein
LKNSSINRLINNDKKISSKRDLFSLLLLDLLELLELLVLFKDISCSFPNERRKRRLPPLTFLFVKISFLKIIKVKIK